MTTMKECFAGLKDEDKEDREMIETLQGQGTK
jgi:hypothetical protein